MAVAQLMTVDDLLALPEDGFRYELIRGELIRMPPPGHEHGVREAKIAYFFSGYAFAHGGVVTTGSGYHLEREPDTVLGPDISFTGPERIDGQRLRPLYPRRAPDVIVEILSESNRPGYVKERTGIFFPAGTRIALFVDDTRRTIQVEHADGRSELLREGDVFDGGEVMPGFRLAVSDAFS